MSNYLYILSRIKQIGFGLVVIAIVFAVLSFGFSDETKEVVVKNEIEKVETIQTPSRPNYSEKQIGNLSKKIDVLLKNAGFNGSCAVLVDNYPIYKGVRGYSNFSSRDTVNFHTPFQLASVSKPITSMVVLSLYEQGEIDLNIKVTSYLPNFPYPDITVHQLLTHTSGLQNYMYLIDKYWSKDKRISNEDVLDLLIEHELPLDFTPGKRHAYSNTGYAMLALIVERVTGDSYYEWVDENIFDEAGMDDAWVWNLAEDTVHNVIGYTTSRRWRRVYNHDPIDEVLGDKSVYCSINDMIKWEQAIAQNLFISDSTMEKAIKPTKIKYRTVPYGYGWRMKEYDSHNVVYHNGLWNGYTASHTRYPDEGITVILLSNTCSKVSDLVRSIHSRTYNLVKQDKKVANKAADKKIGKSKV